MPPPPGEPGHTWMECSTQLYSAYGTLQLSEHGGGERAGSQRWRRELPIWKAHTNKTSTGERTRRSV